jgi:hypothetical protein
MSWITARIQSLRSANLGVRTALTVVAMLVGTAVPVAALSFGAVRATSALFPDRKAGEEETLDSPSEAGESASTGEQAAAPAKAATKPKKAKKGAPSKR